jgi:hypothetical protein
MLPPARGPLSAAVLDGLTGAAPVPQPGSPLVRAAAATPDPIADGDLQLSLALLYELHYTGLPGVSDDREWDPALVALRRELERPLQAWVLAKAPPATLAEQGVPQALWTLVHADGGPSLSSFLLRHATLAQLRSYVVQRSFYQLREADPHTWAVPRLTGRAKVALVEVQTDEYGNGRPDRLHQTLFAGAMHALGLEPTLDRAWREALPEMLAVLTVMSMFGLQRRWRGATAGHLAAYEMTSTTPCRRIGTGLRRLGLGPEVSDYWDEHVEADAVHEQLAARSLCGALAQDEPETVPDILLGAAACLAVEARFGAAMLSRFALAAA